jgi:hypothetical protein
VPWPLVAVPIAGACLAILVATAPDLFLPDASLGWVDVWYYIGFALRLPEALRRYSVLYQADRIGWTLPMYFAQGFFSPLLANYLVKGAFYVATLSFLCGTLRLTCRWRTSLFVTVLAGFYCFVIHAIGAGYTDGPANAYFLMTLYFSTRALSLDGRTWEAGAAGACYAAALFTHFVYIAVLPMFVIYAVAWLLQAGTARRIVIRSCLWFVVGASIVLLLATGLYVHWRVPSAPLAASFTEVFKHPTNDQVFPRNGKWIMDAVWLILPVVAMGWAAAHVLLAFRSGRSALLRLPPVYWLLCSMSGAWGILYFLNAPWVMLPFYSSYLLVPVFLAFGPMVAGPIEQLSALSYRVALAALFVAGPLSYRLAHLAAPVHTMLLAIILLLIATWYRLASGARAVPFVAAFVLGVASVNAAGADYAAQIRNGYRLTRMHDVYDDPDSNSVHEWNQARLFRDVVEASTTLEARLGPGPFYFWYNADDSLGMVFRSVTSTFFAWSTRDLLSEDFVGADEGAVRAALRDRPTCDLVILSRAAHVSFDGPAFKRRWMLELTADGVPYYVHYFVYDPSADADADASTEQCS